jgi:hypothetical protein
VGPFAVREIRARRHGFCFESPAETTGRAASPLTAVVRIEN